MGYDLDCLVVGAGVIGLATARALALDGRDVLIAERNELIGAETSSRNSEVIHAGIYYPQGSLKARLCVRGKALLYDYLRERDLPFDRCGKLIVASDAEELKTVHGYIERAARNGVHDLRRIERDEIASLEPAVNCVGGVLSPSTGVLDSHAYMLSLQGDLERAGGMIAFGTAVRRVVRDGDGFRLETDADSFTARTLVNAGGLWACDLARQITAAPQAWYARGHYYAYSGAPPFSRLIYPVAVAGGLGVHVTLDIAGQVKFGPDVQWLDSVDYTFDDTRQDEFVSAIRRYYPDLDATRLHPSYTGIRPKIAPPDGGFQDFIVAGPRHHGVPGLVNLLGIESPGLTASLAVAEEVLAVLA